MRTFERHGSTYVSVTSAMQLIKRQLCEPDDYYGPLASMHAAEGEGCHRVCLDWLASREGWLPTLVYPEPPVHHPNQERWVTVLDRSLRAFRTFVNDYQIRPIGIEQEDFSARYGLVGHIDLPTYFTLPGRREMRGPCDLKFVSKLCKSHLMQVRCYGRLDGMRGSQMGLIFQCNRDTGSWQVKPVNLMEDLDDVIAVSAAAKIWAYGKKQAHQSEG